MIIMMSVISELRVKCVIRKSDDGDVFDDCDSDEFVVPETEATKRTQNDDNHWH